MTGYTLFRPVLLLVALLWTGIGALDPNKSFSLSSFSGKAAELLKNKLPIQSDSSSFNLRPDGGFELSWDWNKQNGSPRKSSIGSTSSNNHVLTNMAMMGSLISWLYASWVALMTPHPNPAVAATLPLRHDILTFGQAVAFQVPIMVAAYTALKQSKEETLHRRLLLGIGCMSLWTGAGVFFGKTFSRGYELFSNDTRYAVAGVELAIGVWSFWGWAQSVEFQSLGARLLRGSVGSIISLLHPCIPKNKPFDNPEDTKTNDIALYTASTMGLLGLAVLPQLVSFPTATIPTILGKRFSRAASGITFLASVMAYCVRDVSLRHKTTTTTPAIQTLRLGLAIGAIGHLFLVVGKLVGIDGGGLLLEGDGLWEFYPSMVNASRAVTTLMLVTFFTTAFVCTR